MSRTAVIDIGSDAAGLSAAVPVRRLVYLVLLLAIRDRATEVRFEPSAMDGKWKLRYKVGDTWYEMVPVPLHVTVSREIRRLAKLDLFHRPWAYLRRLVTGRAAVQEGRIRLLVAGEAIDLQVIVEPARVGGPSAVEAVALRLPQDHLLDEDAGRLLRDYATRILREYLERRPAVESSENWG